MWCFHSTETYRDAILAAVNLGDGADTTAAVCGQIAGTTVKTAFRDPGWSDWSCAQRSPRWPA
ncbi:MAG: ADP-ribosylglycohydrolase family protein [Caldilineaceae bacterium]